MLDCKLSWSKHIDSTVAKMGRSLSVIKRCCTFLTTLSTRQVLQALVSIFLTTLSTRKVLQVLVLSHLDYCAVVWSDATKKDGWTLVLHRELILIICMSISPGRKWRDWLHHYFYLWEILTCWMHRAVCLNYWHTARTPMHTPQEVSSQSSPEQTMGGTQYYIEPWLHGTLFHIK